MGGKETPDNIRERENQMPWIMPTANPAKMSPEEHKALLRDHGEHVQSPRYLSALTRTLSDGLSQVSDQASYDKWREHATALWPNFQKSAPPDYDQKWQQRTLSTAGEYLRQAGNGDMQP